MGISGSSTFTARSGLHGVEVMSSGACSYDQQVPTGSAVQEDPGAHGPKPLP